jgi:hypothetical protein
MGHLRPSRLARNAIYDRSCLKADIRRPPTGLILEIEIAQRLPSGVLRDEARVVVLLDRPRRREPACGRHGAMIARGRCCSLQLIVSDDKVQSYGIPNAPT